MTATFFFRTIPAALKYTRVPAVLVVFHFRTDVYAIYYVNFRNYSYTRIITPMREIQN